MPKQTLIPLRVSVGIPRFCGRRVLLNLLRAFTAGELRAWLRGFTAAARS